MLDPETLEHGDQTDSAGLAAVPVPVISVRNLSKQIGPQTILRNVTLEINKGELLVVLGPSGSGKTTLLRIIAGLDQPDQGEVYLDGELANAFATRDRQLGVVFQEQALFPRMTAAENIAYGLRVRRTDRAQKSCAHGAIGRGERWRSPRTAYRRQRRPRH